MTADLTATIFDLKRFAIHDGPGIRTTVFFKGCKLSCKWCHNPESQSFEIEHTDFQIFGKKYTIPSLLNEIRKDQLYFEESGGGVTFSGGEPLHQFSFLTALAQQCKSEGIHTTLDTCGYCEPVQFKQIVPFIDLFLFDLKIISNPLHQRFTGVSNDWILANLDYLADHKSKVIIRIPIIPTINDTSEEISQFLHLLKQYDNFSIIHLLPYHTIGSHKYTQLNRSYQLLDLKEPTNSYMHDIAKEFQSRGFSVKIGG